MITVAAIIILVAIVAMAWPFFQKGADVFMPFAEVQGSGRKELREYKSRLILALKELDFDFETGKLSKEDYKSLREKYQAETVEVMKEIEKTDENWKKLQEAVNQEVSPSAPVANQESAKATVAADKKFCSSCGHPLSPKDRFCGSCGAAIQEAKIA